MTLLADVLERGLRSAQPAATDVAPGTLYFVTDELVTEQSNGTIWQAYSGGGGSGDVTGPGSSTAHHLAAFAGATGKVLEDSGILTSDAVTKTAAQTLTNKTLTSPVINTPTGIVKGDVGLGNVDNTSDATKNAAAVTLTNKTLTTPVIADFTNAAHNHHNAAGGAQLDEDALALTNVTINDSSTSKHGFLKKLSNVSTEFMNGVGAWATPAGGGGSGIPIPGGTAAAGKRVTWVQKGNFNNDSTMVAVGQGAVAITGGTGVFDSSGAWAKPTSSSGGQASVNGSNFFTRPDLLPKLIVRLRTPAAITTVRFLIGINMTADPGVGNTVNTDTPNTSTERGFYFRYSTAVPDGGWVAQTVDGSGRTLSSTILAIAVSTIYVLTLTVVSSSLVTFDINGTSVNITTNIPTTDSMGWQISIGALTAVTRSMDIESIYLESN